jgi:SAM-dependent methyltransferase
MSWMKNSDWEFWDSKAGGFDRKQARVIGDRCDIQVDSWLKSRLRPDDSVLDIGCGTGRYARLVSPLVREVLAVDGSSRMLAECEKLSTGSDNLTIERGDCTDLRYPDGHFSVVVMGNLLHIISEPGAAIAEAFRVLRHGGRAYAIDYTMKGMGLLARIGLVTRYLLAWGPPPRTSVNLSDSDISKMMISEGFDICGSSLTGDRVMAACVEGVKP